MTNKAETQAWGGGDVTFQWRGRASKCVSVTELPSRPSGAPELGSHRYPAMMPTACTAFVCGAASGGCRRFASVS